MSPKMTAYIAKPDRVRATARRMKGLDRAVSEAVCVGCWSSIRWALEGTQVPRSASQWRGVVTRRRVAARTR
jgi:hypothetical protein